MPDVDSSLTTETALDLAARTVGSATELAARIGVVQSAISNWKARGRVPAEYCIAIERETGGIVTVEQLRPDVDWGVIRRSEARPPRPSARAATAGLDASITIHAPAVVELGEITGVKGY